MDFEGGEQEESDSNEEVIFPWEEQLVPLPQELQVLWQRYGAAGSRFETKQMLEVLPKYQTLPPKPSENNLITRFEAAGTLGRLDKAAKTTQQFVLHLLRALTVLYQQLKSPSVRTHSSSEDVRGGANPEEALQHVWAFAAAHYAKLEQERKEAALPGSATTDKNVLFGQEEVRDAQQRRRVKELRKGSFRVPRDPSYSFRGFSTSPSLSGGFKGGKAKGQGQGGRYFTGQGGRFQASQGGWGVNRGGFKGGRGKGRLLSRVQHSPCTLHPQGEAGALESPESTQRSAADDQPRCVVGLANHLSIASLSNSKIPGGSAQGATHCSGVSPGRGFERNPG
jgi:hypothetical protein